jgi:hypothetical protein
MSAMYASRSKSCREPLRGEVRGIWRQTWSQRARRGGGGGVTSYGRPDLVRGANPMYGAHEVSSFAFMHSNRQRCVRDRTTFVMVDPNFHVYVIAWHAQSCCGRLWGTARGDVEPTQAAKSLATELEHFEVCHGGVFCFAVRV